MHRQAWRIIKNRLQHSCFSCEFCEIFMDTYFTEHLCRTVPADAYSECSQLFKMELFAKIVDYFQLFTIFTRSFVLDFWLSSEQVSVEFLIERVNCFQETKCFALLMKEKKSLVQEDLSLKQINVRLKVMSSGHRAVRLKGVFRRLSNI